MSRWRRWVLRELIYVVVLGTPIALFFLVAIPRADAARLLKELNQVRVRSTSFNRVEKMAAQFGGNAACVGDNCLFEFQNVWLHRLHLAPLTEFSVMLRRGGSALDPGGGTVAAMDMAMLVTRDFHQGGTIASALVFERSRPGPNGPYQASIVIGANGQPNRTIVQLSPASTAVQRKQARAFNLQCLTQLGGCKTSRQLLPGVWRGARRLEDVYAPPAAGSSSSRAAADTSATIF